MDIGFHDAGFDVVWANDIDKNACATHRAWSGSEVVCSDVASLDIDRMPATDVIAGGFPCQGFSLAGPRVVDDSRNSLYKHFVRCVDVKRPMAFVAENVKGILTLGNGAIIRTVRDEFADKGYTLSIEVLNASDHLVPQDRHRVIIVGVRGDIEREFLFPPPCSSVRTMRDAIGSLPPPDLRDVCRASYSSRYMSRNRNRGWDFPSFTIPAMAKQMPLHPSSPPMQHVERDVWRFREGENRRLSWIEAALLQSFPAGMSFSGDLTSKYRQIGNAVPPRLAFVVARELLKCLT